MFKKSDPQSLTQYFGLYDGASAMAELIGYLIAEYSVMRYDDVQVQNFQSVVKPKVQKYILTCSQRMIIYNPSGLVVHPTTEVNSYDNYPALVNTSIQINTDAKTGVQFQLLDYSPKTVNTQIQKSESNGDTMGKLQSSSSSSTVGSSTSQSNSFGASVSVGLTELTDSISSNFEHSSTQTHDHSRTTGSDSSTSSGTDSSASANMTIKDWGAYALVNPPIQTPNWIFGQEYPWNAIDSRKTNGTMNPKNMDQYQLLIPESILQRLYENGVLNPPSQLSTFGINFVSKGNWLIIIENDQDECVEINHNIDYFTASHTVDTTNNTAIVFMDKMPTGLTQEGGKDIVTTIDLPILGLGVLGRPKRPAIIGFIPSKFTVLPVPVTKGVPVPFKIVATTDSLYVRDTTQYPANCQDGAGFSASQTALTASFAANCTTLSLTAYFKVIDTINDYKLYLKHWKTGNTGLMLTIIINEDADNALVQYVDAREAEGGESNLLTINLRNRDYSSVDFHDYLQLGLNSIEVVIQPIDGTFVAGDNYQVRAISIEAN